MKHITVYFLLVLSLIGSTWADRLLDPNETETIIRHLTQTPRKSWIQQGVIRARHMEYYDFDDSMKDATETIYTDGLRFRYEIHLEDGIPLEGTSDQSMARQFHQDFRLNKHRVFLWDGQKYIQYYQSADYGKVTVDSLQKANKELCGPATAGIVPWGHGDFTYLVILSQKPECHEILQDGQHRVSMTYISDTISPDTAITFILDPAKDYAVMAYSIENDQALLRQTYEDYFLVGDKWVPSKLLIERMDKRSGTPILISYEDWQFEMIDPSLPAEDVFSVNFKNGTMVELKAADNLQTFMYHASDRVDIANILEDKIAILKSADPDSINCATAVIQHVTKRFAKQVLQPELASLVSVDTKKTALSDMKQTFEASGLNCMAIETDLETLDKIPNCTKILYLSLSKHYVILDHVDHDGVWVIDLTSRKFYVKRKMEEVMQEWTNGVALLVSNEPITPPLDSQFRYLGSEETSQIFGGADFGTYSCTDKIQENEHVNCPPKIGFLCVGAYYIFYERYGCIEDENGGVCVGEKKPGYARYHCINDPFNPADCQFPDNEEPIIHFIRACL
jgi:hypothetical protein